MPLFDFSNLSGAPTVKSGFWIYWAITIPLTITVLVAYLTYLVRIQRRDRLEDRKIERRLNEEDNVPLKQAIMMKRIVSRLP